MVNLRKELLSATVREKDYQGSPFRLWTAVPSYLTDRKTMKTPGIMPTAQKQEESVRILTS